MRNHQWKEMVLTILVLITVGKDFMGWMFKSLSCIKMILYHNILHIFNINNGTVHGKVILSLQLNLKLPCLSWTLSPTLPLISSPVSGWHQCSGSWTYTSSQWKSQGLGFTIMLDGLLMRPTVVNFFLLRHPLCLAGIHKPDWK